MTLDIYKHQKIQAVKKLQRKAVLKERQGRKVMSEKITDEIEKKLSQSVSLNLLSGADFLYYVLENLELNLENCKDIIDRESFFDKVQNIPTNTLAILEINLSLAASNFRQATVYRRMQETIAEMKRLERIESKERSINTENSEIESKL